jgi:hypothetical protein
LPCPGVVSDLDLDLMTRLRELSRAVDLDAGTAQLLRDAEAAIARLMVRQQPLAAAGAPDFMDTSFIPGQETQEALVTAALDHSTATHTTAFLVPVPGTAPEVVVAFGDRETLIDLLGDQLKTD